MRPIPGARPPDPKDLVRVQDRLTFLYVERCTINRDSNAITVADGHGIAHVPAAALSVLGVEPRLLRGLRAGAEREAGLLTQLVTPVARGRAPGASDRAAELSRELATLSGRLHTLLVAAGLRDARR